MVQYRRRLMSEEDRKRVTEPRRGGTLKLPVGGKLPIYFEVQYEPSTSLLEAALSLHVPDPHEDLLKVFRWFGNVTDMVVYYSDRYNITSNTATIHLRVLKALRIEEMKLKSAVTAAEP